MNILPGAASASILLVEDDPGIGRFVSRGLAAEGYAVDWRRGGNGVATALASEGYAAAVLDLGLPDMDGLDLCRTLRRDGIDVPVLMLTARASLDDRLDGFRVGADDYLPKPFAFEELVARLKVLVRRGQGGRRLLAVGTLALDLDRRRATIGATEVMASPREFDLLAFLAERAGQVVARTALLDGVWGQEADRTENNVDVYIGYLRRRIAGIDGAPTIATVRGQGFRLT
ncbi:response regulator transcription factor [Sphingomonas aliaeris]|uniref:Response regulator transcription factor n=1 Tax=Sphingomonas aliaeris TaxID=2759526 RepID=A0A974S4K4_9SPHN|nr:response regulator transcription factor [Sphingomonas aliaeris]QQV77544.1 response regulator transcription factor [Sphingomonas aliaeris]